MGGHNRHSSTVNLIEPFEIAWVFIMQMTVGITIYQIYIHVQTT